MAKRATAKKKAQKQPTQREVLRIFGECAFAIGGGAAAQASASGVQIELSKEGAAYWSDRYWKTIPKGMKYAPWKAARPTVIMQARQLGVEAATAAIARTGPGAAQVLILLEDVKPASRVVEKDPKCRSNAATKGSGRYCQV